MGFWLLSLVVSNYSFGFIKFIIYFGIPNK